MSENTATVGRNAPCQCGSGKKFKHCHYGQGQAATAQERADKSGALAIGAAIAVVVGVVVGFAVDVTTGVGVGGGVLAGVAGWIIFRDPPPPKAGGGDAAAINFGV
jgi:hypothetical protein